MPQQKEKSGNALVSRQCFTFAVISSCSSPPVIPPFNLCHFQQSSLPAKCHGPATPAHRWRAPLPSRDQRTGVGGEAAQGHGTLELCPFQPRGETLLSLAGCLLQIPLLPGGAFKAMFSPALLGCVWKFSTSIAIRIWRLTHFQ